MKKTKTGGDLSFMGDGIAASGVCAVGVVPGCVSLHAGSVAAGAI